MKLRIILIILLSSALYNNAFSQEFYFGLRGGYNKSTLHSSNESSPTLEPRTSFSIGAVYCSEPNTTVGKLGYTIEFGYTQKGAIIDSDSLDYKFHYLSAPLLIDIYPIPRLKLSAGLEFSYLTKARNNNIVYVDSVVFENNIATDTITSKVDRSYSLLNTYDKRFEVAGIVDASYAVSFFMNVGFRYSHSFTNVSKYDGILDRQDLRNSYFQVYLLLKLAN